MLIGVPNVLDATQVAAMRTRLDAAADSWVDGRVTAGHQGMHVKHNLQMVEDSPVARELGDVIVGALERNPLFLSAALPARIYPPMFNRYEAASGMHFGKHVDGAVRLLPGTSTKIRTDISATLFLSERDEYDGGELQIEDTYGAHSVKLGAGDLILYPSTSVHQVAPVMRGVRVASFFWIQSLVREDAQRSLLFDLDMSIVRLTKDAPNHESLVSLTGCYHNLLRMWTAP